MIFEMMTGYPPFDFDEEEDMDHYSGQDSLDHKIINDEVEFPQYMSPAAVSIVMQLLTKEPSERLGSNGSFEALRQHPFFEGTDWQALQEKRVPPPEMETLAKKETKEDNHSFGSVIKEDNEPCTMNQNLFEGFSFKIMVSSMVRFASPQHRGTGK
jgi:serine/threonine protein kinase